MASLSDDTLVVRKIVRKLPAEGRRSRRQPTRSGPEPHVHWPWVVAFVLWLAAVAEPVDWIHELRLAAQAQALLRVLPG